MRVVVASRNRHKLREIGVLLAGVGLPWDLVAIDEVAPGCALVEEEPSFEGNALSKARQAAAASGVPALADDSGIEVDALDGAPGVYSARWSGEPCDDARNNQKMLAELAGVPMEKRTARYRCAAAFVDPARGSEIVRTGTCEGRLLESPRGTGGFGYDPLFLVESLGLTMAEIALEDKNRLSHRAAAFRQLAQALVEFELVR
ncbi:MAG TPA: RdgB/HAM1 family non-canonical purine NTP pyrophosphatase [Polyangia bacterium]|nr:RdgB/HAM1 family non-canonical purine NTP pyrophosphatase [Polyangia bacterium]